MKLLMLGAAWAGVLGAQIVNIPNTTFPAVRNLLNSNFSFALDRTATYDDPAWLHSLAYSKLVNAPVIPTLLSQLSNDAGYLTGGSSVAWSQVTSVPAFANTASSYTDPTWLTITKTKVGLAAVENTALSTWGGSSNLTTLGTIGTGVWHGTAIGDTYISSASVWNAKQAAITTGSTAQYIRGDLSLGAFPTTVAGYGITDGVKLQATTPGTQQTGNLNLSGAGLFAGVVSAGTAAPWASATFQAHTGTDQNLAIGGPLSLSTGVTLHSLNDAISGNQGFELRGNPLKLFGGGQGLVTAGCTNAASPAVCLSASAGAVVLAAGATTVVVNTTVVTSNSEILLTFDSSMGSTLGVTCNTTVPTVYGVSARTGGSNFTIKATAPTTNPACFSFFVIN